MYILHKALPKDVSIHQTVWDVHTYDVLCALVCLLLLAGLKERQVGVSGYTFV